MAETNTIKPEERLIVALDNWSEGHNNSIKVQLQGIVSFYKVGLIGTVCKAFYYRNYDCMFTIIHDTFLDLKLPNDIPNTIENTVKILSQNQSPLPLLSKDHFKFLSISESATEATIKAAIKGRGNCEYPKLLMVFNLSSDGVKDYAKRHNIELGHSSTYWHMRVKADMAMKAGVDGFIASGPDVPFIRECYPNAIIVSPGIRPEGFSNDDHVRTFTPKLAIKKGADYIVVGRPITQAANMAGVAKDIIKEIKEGLRERSV